jgi:hypothetical protein
MAVGGTLGLIMFVILLGKSHRKINPVSYALIVVVALLQVAIVFYVMYTLQPPEQ